MVQVSYPGVYVQEVPSGARAITGVATSIAAFVGMARRGPVNEPVQVLSFSDYERAFSSDTSEGEMTDQVRQFFLNGGQRAYVVRVADGAAPSHQDFGSDGGGGEAFTLTSRSFGLDANQIRARIDYGTSNPGSTFNLTLYRETFDAAGNPTTSDEETHSGLSLLAGNPRFVQTVLQRDSRLVTAEVAASFAANDGISRSGRVAADMAAAVGTATSGLMDGRFSMTIEGLPAQTVTIASAGSVADTDVQSAARLAFADLLADPADITVSYESFAAGNILQVMVTGRTVRLGSAAQNDIAAALGLGVENGGHERGALAALRPDAAGIVFDDDPEAAAMADRAPFFVPGAAISLSGPEGFTIDLADAGFEFPDGGTGGTMLTGTTPNEHLANVAENLGAIATLINREQTNWLASVHGLRLVVRPLFGNAATTAAADLSGPGYLTDVGQTRNPAAVALGSAAKGAVARRPNYAVAFESIRKNVDLFNLMILPRSADDGDGSIREEVWGPASSFCFEERAFLLLDAAPGLTEVSDVPAAVRRLRIGLKKDHAGFYWPRVQISSEGNRKTIDPSGTIAGLMARTDANRGVWKAPAGIEAELLGTLGSEVRMSDRENGTLNPEAVNAIRVFPNGIISWGARTMDGFDNSGNLDYKYVSVRRVALFIAESLERGLKFAVFEPNDEPLWAQIRLAAGGFMNNLFRQGAFQGSTAREAYFVKVDRETTTQNDINLGIVNVAVGFASLKPAEFVVVTLQQKAGQIQI